MPTTNNTANPAGSPTLSDLKVTPTSDPPSEFASFESLAAKLVNVPKSEIDEQRENES